jgi:PAS domain S-box-containing protein
VHQNPCPSEDASEAASAAKDIVEIVGAADPEDLAACKRFLDHAPVAVMVSRRTGDAYHIVYVNKTFENLVDCSAAELMGRDWSILDDFQHEDEADLSLAQALQSTEDSVGAFRLDADTPVLVEVYAGTIQDEDGKESYHIAALVDVSRRERAQREEFARQIREKDLLLREVQHRVKNNLQLITALIRLEARTAQNGDAASLDRLAGRIESLHFLYQALASADPGHDIDLGQYLSQIASGVMRTHAVEGLRLDVRVENAPVSINIAMPVGLAVNELLTNAFKYAFAGREAGVITLECLREDEDRYRVSVSDDGIGLPPGVSWPAEGKLGALIAQSLRENTETELRVESDKDSGTRVTIRFVYCASARKAA